MGLQAILHVEGGDGNAQPSGGSAAAANSSQTHPPPVVHSTASRDCKHQHEEQPRAARLAEADGPQQQQQAPTAESGGSTRMSNGTNLAPPEPPAGHSHQESPTSTARRLGIRRGFFDSPAAAERSAAADTGAGSKDADVYQAPNGMGISAAAAAEHSAANCMNNGPAPVDQPAAKGGSYSAPEVAAAASAAAPEDPAAHGIDAGGSASEAASEATIAPEPAPGGAG